MKNDCSTRSISQHQMPKLHRSLCPSMADQTVKWEHPCVTSPRDTACRTDVYVACLRILERKNWRIDVGNKKICLNFYIRHTFYFINNKCLFAVIISIFSVAPEKSASLVIIFKSYF